MTKYERILGLAPKTNVTGAATATPATSATVTSVSSVSSASSASSASSNGCFNGASGTNLEEFIESLQYVDESPDANSGGEGDNNTQGSQVSISQLSTVASSGYQRWTFNLSARFQPLDLEL